MEELIYKIRSELASAWRFRWWAISTAWIVGVLGAFVIALLPDQYEASARVFVDASSRLDEVIGSVAIEWNMQDQLERVRQEMLSRPVLETVARQTDLDLLANTPAELMGVVTSLQQRIIIEETRRRAPDPRMVTDSVLTIRFSDQHRETALAVVENLLDTFINDVVRGGQGESESAREVVSAQIAGLRERLKRTEDAIAQFKSENVGLLPGNEGDYFFRLQSATEELRDLEGERRSALQRRDTLRAQLASGTPTLPAGSTVVASSNIPGQTSPGNDTQSRINQTETQLSDLLLRYTDAHPEVQQLRQQLEQLRDRREEELAALAEAAGTQFEGARYATNPVYQQIQSALNAANVDLADLEAQIAERQLRVDELRAQMDIIPRKEAELRALEREYDELKAIHDELVGNLERERLGTVAVQDDVNFSVIEEPFAGFTPTAPNRMLLNAAVLAVAFGLGGGLAYFLSLLNPVFSNSRALREYAELPVLGSITISRTQGQLLVRRLQIFALAGLAMALVAAYAVLIVFSQEAAVFVQSLTA